MRIYITVLLSLILLGFFLAGIWLVGNMKSSTRYDQAALLPVLTPTTEVISCEPCEPVCNPVAEFVAPSVAPTVMPDIVFDALPAPAPILSLETPQPIVEPIVQEQPAAAPAPVSESVQLVESAAPASFVYFFHGPGTMPVVPYAGVSHAGVPANYTGVPTKNVIYFGLVPAARFGVFPTMPCQRPTTF